MGFAFSVSMWLSALAAGLLATTTFGSEPKDESGAEDSVDSYDTYFSEAAHLLRANGPVALRINWNPKAPAPMQGRYDYELMIVSDNEVVALQRAQALKVDCAAWFSKDTVRLVDNTTRICVDLEGIDFKNLGGASGTLAEIHAGRLLLGYVGYSYLSEYLGENTTRHLKKTSTMSALRYIYCDEARNVLEVGSTELRRVGGPTSRELEWRDDGGAIFTAVASDADRSNLETRLRSFEWAKTCPRQRRPELAEVLKFMKDFSVEMASDSQIVLQTPQSSEVLAKRPDKVHGYSESCHVEYRGKRLFLYVGDGWGTVGAPPRVVAQNKNVVVTKDFDDAGQIFGAAVNPEGQDWVVGYVMPGGPDNFETERAVTPILAEFLRAFLARTERGEQQKGTSP